ncbi:hypothetical protein P0Y31_04735 [Knoellia sp. 3-2P3]|uniref:hypothetical protein n=1 Tax=unclassified Knoellia TaxID=2618719 RepID=UPI0023DB1169|nr:hypothetical protein [Knoellia sp. 3-2P3]MDF2091639.1 hypothetical protein [Knoellia sp. 3-2P3]
MPDEPETSRAAGTVSPAGASDAVPMTRAQRRAQAAQAARATQTLVLPPITSRRPLAVASTIAFSALIALTGYAHPVLVALAVALAGLVMAWGWPALLGLPSRFGTTVVLVIGALSCTLAAALSPDEPFLRWVPAALAVSLIAAFLHQLLRRDGRPRLTESVAASGAGLAVIASGASYIPLPHTLGGPQTLAAAMAGLGLAALADLAVPTARLRAWALPLAMVLGGLAGLLATLPAGRPQPATGALIGVLVAGTSHATRRVLAVLPSMVSARSQLVSGAASVLLCGVVAYTLGRLLVA